MEVLTNLTLIFFLRQMNLKSSYLQFSKEKYALDGATSLQNERKNRNAETKEREKKKNEDTCDDGVDPVLLLADTCNENQ